MAAASPASPTAAAPGKVFFSHALSTIDDKSAPEYYTSLYDQHVGATSTSELAEFEADFVRACLETTKRTAAEPALPFVGNESLQAVFDVPVQAYASTEAWDKRKATLKQATQTWFQKLPTILNAQFNHATVKSAAGFDRRDVAGRVYVHHADGVYVRIWRSASMAKELCHGFSKMHQTIFEHQLKNFRVPVTSLVSYRGICMTALHVCPMTDLVLNNGVPLIPEDGVNPLEDISTLPTGARWSVALAAEADLLRGALTAALCPVGAPLPPFSDFGFRWGLDGRIYVTSTAWMRSATSMPLLDRDCSRLDQSVLVRPEALCIVAHPMSHPIASSSLTGQIDPSQLPFSFSDPQQNRELVTDRLVPLARQALMLAVEKLDRNLGAVLTKGVVARVLHEHGVNVRFLFAVLDGLNIATEGGGAAAGDLTKATREVIEAEMVFRTMKEMTRSELWSSTGEDDATHAQRVNRLFSAVSTKKTGVWQNQLMAILRRKFSAPADYTITLTATLLKYATALFSSRVGVAYDKEQSRFVGFAPVHLGVSYMNTPAELGAAQAANAAAKADAEGGDSLAASTTMSQSMSSFSPAGSGVFPSQARTGNVPGQRATATKTAGSSNALLGTPGRAAEISKLSAQWQPRLERLQRELSSSASSSSRMPFVGTLAQLLRLLALERLFASDTLEAHLVQLKATLGLPDLARGKLGALALRLVAGNDGAALKTADRTAVEAQCGGGAQKGHLLLAEDDAVIRARYMMQCAKSEASAEKIVVACHAFRAQRSIDLGLLPDYFSALVHTGGILNANADAQQLNAVLRLACRTVERFDFAVRRQQSIALLRRTAATLITSQNIHACMALKEAVFTSLRVHIARFGVEDVQTSVCFGQCVYITCNAHLSRLSDVHVLELRKFHYFVSSMGTSTLDVLRETLRGEPYNNSLAIMIAALLSVGEETLASKALVQTTVAQGTEAPENAAMSRATLLLQGGAASRLQRMIRSVRTTGNELYVRRWLRMDAAFRVGVVDIEPPNRLRIERLFVEEMAVVDRPAMAKLETVERQKIIDLVWRGKYEARRGERVTEHRDYATKGAKGTPHEKGGDESAAPAAAAPPPPPAPVAVRTTLDDATEKQMEQERHDVHTAIVNEEEVGRRRATADFDAQLLALREKALANAEFDRKQRVARQLVEEDEAQQRGESDRSSLTTLRLLQLESSEWTHRVTEVHRSLRGLDDAAAAFLSSGKVLLIVNDEERLRGEADIAQSDEYRQLSASYQQQTNVLKTKASLVRDEESARKVVEVDTFHPLALVVASAGLKLVSDEEIAEFNYLRRAMTDPKALAKMQQEARAREQAVAAAHAEQKAQEQRLLKQHKDERTQLGAQEATHRERIHDEVLVAIKSLLVSKNWVKAMVLTLKEEADGRAASHQSEAVARSKLAGQIRGQLATALHRESKRLAEGPPQGDEENNPIRRQLEQIRAESVALVRREKMWAKQQIEEQRREDQQANAAKRQKIRAPRLNSPRLQPNLPPRATPEPASSDRLVDESTAVATANNPAANNTAAAVAAPSHGIPRQRRSSSIAEDAVVQRVLHEHKERERKIEEERRELARAERQRHHQALVTARAELERRRTERKFTVLKELSVHAMTVEQLREEIDADERRRREEDAAARGDRPKYFCFDLSLRSPRAVVTLDDASGSAARSAGRISPRGQRAAGGGEPVGKPQEASEVAASDQGPKTAKAADAPPSSTNATTTQNTVVAARQREKLLLEACLAIRAEEAQELKQKALQVKAELNESKSRREMATAKRAAEIQAIAHRRREEREALERAEVEESDAQKKVVAEEKVKHAMALQAAAEARKTAAHDAHRRTQADIERRKTDADLEERRQQQLAEERRKERDRQERIRYFEIAGNLRLHHVHKLAGKVVLPPIGRATPPPSATLAEARTDS